MESNLGCLQTKFDPVRLHDNTCNVRTRLQDHGFVIVMSEVSHKAGMCMLFNNIQQQHTGTYRLYTGLYNNIGYYIHYTYYIEGVGCDCV